VVDVQECPKADLAICAAICAVLKALVEERWSPLAQQQAMTTEALSGQLLGCIRDADQASIVDAGYLELFGVGDEVECKAGELWRRVLDALGMLDALSGPFAEPLRIMLDEGPLARRILHRVGDEDSHERLTAVYGELCDCLHEGRILRRDG